MIKLITLDLEGVFFDDPKDIYVKELAKYYSKTEAFIETLLFHDAIEFGQYNELKLGKVSSAVYWDWFFKKLDITDKVKKNKDNYLEVAMGFYNINQDVVKLIKQLKKQNIKIGLCSNNYKDKIEYLEKTFQLSDYFDFMLFSYDIGYFKTDQNFFIEMIKKSKLNPNEILYSDNKETQLSEAKRLGINTYLYDNFTNFKKHLSIFLHNTEKFKS